MEELKYKVEYSGRQCWYRLRHREVSGKLTPLPAKAGRFFLFTVDFMEFESGPGHYPVAIVEDHDTGAVHVVHAEDVCFGTVPKFA